MSSDGDTELERRLRGADGRWLPAHLELSEGSGPVSPRYAYTTRIVIRTDGDTVRLEGRDRGEVVAGAPQRDVVVDGELPADRYRQLWRDLLAEDALARGADLIGEAGRKVRGASFNHVELRLGEQHARTDYLLVHLDDPTHAPLARIIARLKGTLSGL